MVSHLFLKVSAVLAMCLCSVVAKAQENISIKQSNDIQKPWNLSLGVSLQFFGLQYSGEASYRLNEFLSFGVMGEHLEVVKTLTDSAYATVKAHPLGGAWYAEAGAGIGKERPGSTYGTQSFGPAGLFRMGNRWNFSSGMTVGITYAGFSWQKLEGRSFGSFLLVGVDVGVSL